MKDFNIIINGVGGQGLITLLQIIAETALLGGYDVRTSELHGLSQRGGSVEVHIRFGRKIYSPLVSQGAANLIISLETQEALSGLRYASSSTIFLINKYSTPTFTRNISEGEVTGLIKKTSGNVLLIPASDLCQASLNTDVVAGIYLLGLAVSKNFLPLKPVLIESAIKKVIPGKYLDLNLQSFRIGTSS